MSTHSLTQHSLGDLIEHWVMNFSVNIGLDALNLTKINLTNFYEIPALLPYKGRIQKHISEHNSAPNYLMMMKLHMGQLDLNAKKSFLAILEFSIFWGWDNGKKR